MPELVDVLILALWALHVSERRFYTSSLGFVHSLDMDCTYLKHEPELNWNIAMNKNCKICGDEYEESYNGPIRERHNFSGEENVSPYMKLLCAPCGSNANSGMRRLITAGNKKRLKAYLKENYGLTSHTFLDKDVIAHYSVDGELLTHKDVMFLKKISNYQWIDDYWKNIKNITVAAFDLGKRETDIKKDNSVNKEYFNIYLARRLKQLANKKAA